MTKDRTGAGRIIDPSKTVLIVMSTGDETPVRTPQLKLAKLQRREMALMAITTPKSVVGHKRRMSDKTSKEIIDMISAGPKTTDAQIQQNFAVVGLTSHDKSKIVLELIISVSATEMWVT